MPNLITKEYMEHNMPHEIWQLAWNEDIFTNANTGKQLDIDGFIDYAQANNLKDIVISYMGELYCSFNGSTGTVDHLYFVNFKTTINGKFLDDEKNEEENSAHYVDQSELMFNTLLITKGNADFEKGIYKKEMNHLLTYYVGRGNTGKILKVNAVGNLELTDDSSGGDVKTIITDTGFTESAKVWYGTKAEYDSLEEKDANTIYNVEEEVIGGAETIFDEDLKVVSRIEKTDEKGVKTTYDVHNENAIAKVMANAFGLEYTETDNALKKIMASAFGLAYNENKSLAQMNYDQNFPVGFTVMSANKPEVPTGITATWEKVSSDTLRYLYVDNDASEGDTVSSSEYTEKHALTLAEMPRHRHGREFGQAWVSGEGPLTPAFRDHKNVSYFYTDYTGGKSSEGSAEEHRHGLPTDLKVNGLAVVLWRRIE